MHEMGGWTSFFRNRRGRIVVAQFPNAPLWVWLVASVVARIADHAIARSAEIVALVALLVWAGMEIVAGASPFRRVLGATVAVFAIWSRL